MSLVPRFLTVALLISSAVMSYFWLFQLNDPRDEQLMNDLEYGTEPTIMGRTSRSRSRHAYNGNQKDSARVQVALVDAPSGARARASPPSPHHYTDPLTRETCVMNQKSHGLLTLAEIEANFSCKRHILFAAMKCADPRATSCTCNRRFIELTAITHAATMSPEHVAFLLVPQHALVTNEYGLPTLKSFYQYAYYTCPKAATYTYLNADILFDFHFVDTVEAAVKWAEAEKLAGNPSEFVLAGPRIDLYFGEYHLDRKRLGQKLRSLRDLPEKRLSTPKETKQRIVDSQCVHVDYFITTRNAIDWENEAKAASEMVIGRPAFDVWLVDRTYRSPDVALISTEDSLRVVHFLDTNNDQGSSNSEWQQQNKSFEDKNYNQLRVWKGPPNGQPTKDGWLVDWGQFGYPCNAHRKTTSVMSGSGSRVIVVPNRMQTVFFRAKTSFDRKRLVNWRRQHQPVITTTIVIIVRSLHSVQKVYEFLRDKTVFDLYPNDTHRIDINFRIDGSWDGRRRWAVMQWLEEDLGNNGSWPYGQWDRTTVNLLSTDQNKDNSSPNSSAGRSESQQQQQQYNEMVAQQRTLLERSSEWVGVRRKVTKPIKQGKVVTSKHTIVIDSAQFMEVVEGTFKVNTPPPSSWYRWFHKIHLNVSRSSHQAVFLYVNNNNNDTTSALPSNLPGPERAGGGGVFAWSFSPKPYTQFVNTNESFFLPKGGLKPLRYEDFCMGLAANVTSCKFLHVTFQRPDQSQSVSSSSDDFTAAIPLHQSLTVPLNGPISGPPHVMAVWTERAYCPSNHSLHHFPPLHMQCEGGAAVLSGGYQEHLRRDNKVDPDVEDDRGDDARSHHGRSAIITGVDSKGVKFEYTEGLRQALGPAALWQGCTYRCRRPLRIDDAVDEQLNAAEITATLSEFDVK